MQQYAENDPRHHKANINSMAPRYGCPRAQAGDHAGQALALSRPSGGGRFPSALPRIILGNRPSGGGQCRRRPVS
jgi:hypothetical protein